MQANQVMVVGTISIGGAPPQDCKITGMQIEMPPPHIWGPTDPRPTPPIYIPPGGGGLPHPEHPIVIPNPPTEPPLVIWGPTDPRPTPPIHWPGYPNWPPTGPSPQPPPDKWYWHYCSQELGWVLVPPGGGGKPQPMPPNPPAQKR